MESFFEHFIKKVTT